MHILIILESHINLTTFRRYFINRFYTMQQRWHEIIPIEVERI